LPQISFTPLTLLQIQTKSKFTASIKAFGKPSYKDGKIKYLDLIRISLKAYDHKLLDKSAEKIIRTAKSTGAIISGPIPMPTKRTVYTVLRSPFVNKKSREQFQTKVHKRVVDIVNSTPKTVESLMKLELPSGVDIEIRG